MCVHSQSLWSSTAALFDSATTTPTGAEVSSSKSKQVDAEDTTEWLPYCANGRVSRRHWECQTLRGVISQCWVTFIRLCRACCQQAALSSAHLKNSLGKNVRSDVLLRESYFLYPVPVSLCSSWFLLTGLFLRSSLNSLARVLR